MDDAPSPSPEDRAAAAAQAIRARREAEAADRAATPSRGARARGTGSGTTRRTAAIAAAVAAGLLAAAAIVWGVVQNQPPAPQETVAGPTATSTPSPTPTPTPTYTLVQVGEDLMANPPEFAHEMELMVWPDTLVAATTLGEHAGWSAVGLLSDTGNFCLWIRSGTEGGHTGYATGEVFQEEGATVDRGAWQVTWMPDGSLVWTGI